MLPPAAVPAPYPPLSLPPVAVAAPSPPPGIAVLPPAADVPPVATGTPGASPGSPYQLPGGSPGPPYQPPPVAPSFVPLQASTSSAEHPESTDHFMLETPDFR